MLPELSGAACGLLDGPHHGDVEKGKDNDGYQKKHKKRYFMHRIPLKYLLEENGI